MGEITAQRRGELVRGVFQVLLDKPDGLPAKNVLKRLETVVPPTPFELEDYPKRPGVRRFEKTVRFCTIKSVKAGWLEKKMGDWTLTDEGRAAYKKFTDPERFEQAATQLYKEWKASDPGPGDPPVLITTIEEAEENAWRDVQDHLDNMPPYDFQDLVAALLEGMDYHVAWISPPGPDKGVDIVAYKDPLGTVMPRIKVQVKRRQDKINVEGVRSFMAVLGDHDVGVFVNTGGFTKDADSEARMQEKRKLTLVDSKGLFDLWIEHYTQIDEDRRRLLPLKAVHYLAPTD